MRLRAALPLIAGLLFSSRVASPDDGPDAGAKPESLPFLGPIPAEKSPPPTLAEWTAALDIGGVRASECKLRRVREWIRFRCVADKLIGAELLGGTASEVSYSNRADACPPAEEGYDYYAQEMLCNARVEIVFPLRRGDRRFFQILRQGKNHGDPTRGTLPSVEVRTVLEVAWVADEPLPVVVAEQYGG